MYLYIIIVNIDYTRLITPLPSDLYSTHTTNFTQDTW